MNPKEHNPLNRPASPKEELRALEIVVYDFMRMRAQENKRPDFDSLEDSPHLAGIIAQLTRRMHEQSPDTVSHEYASLTLLEYMNALEASAHMDYFPQDRESDYQQKQQVAKARVKELESELLKLLGKTPRIN